MKSNAHAVYTGKKVRDAKELVAGGRRGHYYTGCKEE
jgi:hypothetical protein